MTLPSYEEAVYGRSGLLGASAVPPSLPAPPESRVPIVLSEGLPQGAVGGRGPSGTLNFCLPSTSSSSLSFSHHHAETVLVHQPPSFSSSSSSSWAREHPGGACAAPLPCRRDSESSDQHSLLSVTSTDEFSDGKEIVSVIAQRFCCFVQVSLSQTYFGKSWCKIKHFRLQKHIPALHFMSRVSADFLFFNKKKGTKPFLLVIPLLLILYFFRILLKLTIKCVYISSILAKHFNCSVKSSRSTDLHGEQHVKWY